ncbi:MAG: hypothetical protein JXA30_07110 [Deltaproteobacteria bacterium]|nr:hypothetical protein [Deltaproteobacteria bacterium]
MHIWEIILALGAVGSLAMWLRDIFVHHRALKELVYPALAIVLSISSVILYSQNTKLLDPIEQAKVLVKSWPETTYDGRFHEAQAQGIVQAGLRYLETYKSLHPDTYKRLLQEYDKTDFKDSIQATNSADTMITLIRSYAGVPIDLR